MRPSPHARYKLPTVLLAGVTALGVMAAVGSASAATPPPARQALAGSLPGWLHQANDLGAAPASQQVSFGVLLNMRNEAAAAATIKAVSEPGSRDYGHWLTNAQFDARFAPTHSSVAAVESWLRSQGFHVGAALPSGMYVQATGSVAQVDKTFATSVRNYRYLGMTLHGNATALSLSSSTPATVRDAVSGILGIDQGSDIKRPTQTEPGPPPALVTGVQPCSAYYGQKMATDKPEAYGKHWPYAVCGYTPQQYDSAYGVSPLLAKGINGRGVRVAIIDAYAAPTIISDTTMYNKVHGTPQFASGQFSQSTPGADGYDLESECGPQGWYGEETLDVEAVHAMAPGASIQYIGAKDCAGGLDYAWANAIDYHVANIITDSWSDNTDSLSTLGQAYVNFYKQYSMEAAATGITVQFSSGDGGDLTNGGTNLSGKSVGFPSDVPYVTGVGGTSVYIGSKGQWLNEYGWQNDYSLLSKGAWTPAPPGTYSSGGGGGTSVLFDQPFYQKGKVPASISEYWDKTPMRAVPDVAMPADPNTGMVVGETQVFPTGTKWAQYRIGGTSLASPLLAGLLAVADEYTHHSLGFINPLYYKLIGTSALHDIVAPKTPQAQVRTDYTNELDPSQGYTYKLQTIDVQQTTLHDIKGYDDETGVGTPAGVAFFQALLKAVK
jgi:subtilase family serine protease